MNTDIFSFSRSVWADLLFIPPYDYASTSVTIYNTSHLHLYARVSSYLYFFGVECGSCTSCLDLWGLMGRVRCVWVMVSRRIHRKRMILGPHFGFGGYSYKALGVACVIKGRIVVWSCLRFGRSMRTFSVLFGSWKSYSGFHVGNRVLGTVSMERVFIILCLVKSSTPCKQKQRLK